MLEAGYLCQRVVGDVELLEVCELVEAGDLGQTVRLDGDGFEVDERRDVLWERSSANGSGYGGIARGWRYPDFSDLVLP